MFSATFNFCSIMYFYCRTRSLACFGSRISPPLIPNTIKSKRKKVQPRALVIRIPSATIKRINIYLITTAHVYRLVFLCPLKFVISKSSPVQITNFLSPSTLPILNKSPTSNHLCFVPHLMSAKENKELLLM